MDKFLLRFTLILCLLFSPLLVSAQSITGIASVTDGDSLEIRGTRIRLHGIDTPESRQLCTLYLLKTCPCRSANSTGF
jgi:endonuclease YncB( thermonuclease family)